MTGLGLKESKDFVENLETELRQAQPQRFGERGSGGLLGGCSSVVALAIGLTVALVLCPWLCE